GAVTVKSWDTILFRGRRLSSLSRRFEQQMLSAQIHDSVSLLPQEGIGFANGTFGELLQGALENSGNHFLVTLPIQKFSRVAFTPNLSSNHITVTPSHKSKSREFVQKIIEY